MNEPPILAIDVDGVISLFGFEAPPPATTVSWHLIDGTPHCISLAAGERLRRLDEAFELVWATGWEEKETGDQRSTKRRSRRGERGTRAIGSLTVAGLRVVALHIEALAIGAGPETFEVGVQAAGDRLTFD